MARMMHGITIAATISMVLVISLIVVLLQSARFLYSPIHVLVALPLASQEPQGI